MLRSGPFTGATIKIATARVSPWISGLVATIGPDLSEAGQSGV
jgi:hypothetical protein